MSRMQDIDISWEGLQETQQLLKTMPEKVQTMAVMPALKAAGRTVRKRARLNARKHKKSGLLDASIAMVPLNARGGKPPAVLVGIPRKGKVTAVFQGQKVKTKYKAFYGAFLERGWQLTGHAPNKKPIRKIEAKEWLKPAVIQSLPEIRDTFVQYFTALGQSLAREARR